LLLLRFFFFFGVFFLLCKKRAGKTRQKDLRSLLSRLTY